MKSSLDRVEPHGFSVVITRECLWHLICWHPLQYPPRENTRAACAGAETSETFCLFDAHKFEHNDCCSCDG